MARNYGRNAGRLARGCLLASVPLVLGLTTFPQVASAAATNPINPSWPTSLTFASVGAENSTALMISLGPVQDVFKKLLGVTLKVYIGTSYSAVIEAQAAGKVQLATYGPFSYVIAKDLQHEKIEDVGVGITAPGTNGGYYSEAVVDPKRTPNITSIKDLAGQKVCFSDPASTSGYLYPSYALINHGISPTTGVTPVFSGTDSTTALDAAKGECAAGFTNNDSLPVIFTQNHVPHSDIKIIWKSGEIPGSPTAVSESLPASFRAALKKVLIKDANSTYEAAHGYCKSVAACTAITGGWGYAPPSVANYAPVLRICNVTKAPACKLS